MELTSQYLERVPFVPVKNELDFRLHERYEFCRDFISSRESVNAVIAHRRAGKTSAVILRALFNDIDTVILCIHRHQVDWINQQLDVIAEEQGIEIEEEWSMDYTNRWIRKRCLDKDIHIIQINRWQDMRGTPIYAQFEKEIIVDDADYTESILRPAEMTRAQFFHYQQTHSQRFTMVGSIARIENSFLAYFYEHVASFKQKWTPHQTCLLNPEHLREVALSSSDRFQRAEIWCEYDPI